MIKVYCDGCGKHLKGEELEWSNAFLKELQRTDNIFCEGCAQHSGEYWDEKAALLIKINQEAAARLENHMKSFYANARKKLIEVVR